MTTRTDTRLSDEERTILADMVGRQLDRCLYSPSFADEADVAFEVVELHVGGEIYTISNALQVVDYYGEVEEISVPVIRKCAPGSIAPWYGRQRHVEREVFRRIEDVAVYEDEVDRVEGREPFGYAFTRALAFRLGGESLVFERGSEFSEDLDVRRGVRAERKIASAAEEVIDSGDIVLSVNGESYSGNLYGQNASERPDVYRIERRVVSIREWAASRVNGPVETGCSLPKDCLRH